MEHNSLTGKKKLLLVVLWEMCQLSQLIFLGYQMQIIFGCTLGNLSAQLSFFIKEPLFFGLSEAKILHTETCS